ncbi:MAG: isoleucine--tRNA ligase [bacterium]|nr:isoleucine--tRNA ligase [bacterium]
MAKKPVQLPPRPQVDKIETEILKFWQKHRTFQKSIDQRSPDKEYVFYDGPPFATGLPHYGHIVQSTIKDIVPRYFTMRGYRVERRFGWDCHGLPVEYELEKEKNIKNRQQILEWGVDNFNEACRSIVTRYVTEWQKIIPRLGRWVDFVNDYKTMDPNYMESIWWVFKTLYEKGLIYQGHRPAHICPRCATPLSNFEVSLAYKDKQDISVFVKFPVKGQADTYLLAWTTTPWTLPGNMLLAVAPNTPYVKVKSGHAYYILAKSRLEAVFQDTDYQVIKGLNSQELVNLKYQPLFTPQNFDPSSKAYQVVTADFVSLEEGTGIVHIAPAFGEDDFYLGQSLNLPILQHITITGQADSSLYPQWQNTDVFQLNDLILNKLNSRQLVFKQEVITHSYPHCWRCDTPLLNFAAKSWFVKVTQIKDNLIKTNQQIHWVPAHIKNGRFGKWLENVRDWSISRSRFWGTPLPVWQGEKTGKTTVVGSRQELQNLTGQKITDLHLHKIKNITWQDKDTGETMRLAGDVLDCWFESGSMPYASFHYPFENKQRFESHFPADFIAEAIDQTRGWFYTLHVLANALFKKPAFKNCITTGIVLAADGQKMSKSKKNYPDPMKTVQKYGADALRFYLVNSPLVKGNDLRFNDKDLNEIKEKLITTYWNSFKFYLTYADLHNFTPSQKLPDYSSLSTMNQWILSQTYLLKQRVDQAMESYKLYKATQAILDFTIDLSQWYIRRIRDDVAIWQKDKAKTSETLNTLYHTLAVYSQIVAPFIPFISEYIYQLLTSQESVHLTNWPDLPSSWQNQQLRLQMEHARQIVSLGHAQRKSANLKVRQPLNSITIQSPQSLSKDIQQIILDELNIKKAILKKSDKLSVSIDAHITPELEKEGRARDIIRQIQNKRRQLKLQPTARIQVSLPEWPEEFTELIKTKTLAVNLTRGPFSVKPIN